VPLFVAYYRRRLPRFLRARQLIEDGAIGPVRFTAVTFYQRANPQEQDPAHRPWRVVPAVAGGGRFVDLASHTIDILAYLLGDITDADGTAANQAGHYDAEDIVTGRWAHAGGALGTGAWCFTAHDRVDRIEIVGGRGTITLSCFGTEPVRLQTLDGVTEFPEPTPPHIQQPLIQSIVDELNGVGTCPSTGETAARTNWVMDRMLRGYYAARSM
jgi:predicted dehydrogenase